jgi:quercetin dioxygenase-like cupin family protein
MTNAATAPEVGLAEFTRRPRWRKEDHEAVRLWAREADDAVELGRLNEQQTGRLLVEKYADIDSGSELRAANGRRTIRCDHAAGQGGHAMTSRRSRMFVAAIAFVMPVAVQAQDSPQRKELRRVDLSGAAGMEVISSISEFRPGDELPRHLHHGVEAGYVVQGAMVQNPGQPPAMLATGAPILNLRDAVHGGFKVVGPGNLILFTVHTVDKGKPLYDWVK